MKLLLLDRDGVINHDSPHYIKSADEWHPIAGSMEAIAAFKKAGWKIAVVTNQSGLGRGYYDIDTLEDIHQKMRAAVIKAGGEIDAIFFCPHHPDAHCDCRKPKPGLLLNAQHYFSCDLANAYCIGDSWRDIEAAQAVGAHPVLVLTGNGEKHRKQAEENHISCYENLLAAAHALINLDPADKPQDNAHKE